jgi:hypothetical protein
MSEGTEHHLEHAEHTQHAAHNPFDRRVAMTMTILAAILAGVTLLSHRGHTETLRLATVAGSKHTEATDVWNLYQAKNIRSHEFQSYLILEELLARDAPKQDENANALRSYWISQVNKYEGDGYWPRFRDSLKDKRGNPSDEPETVTPVAQHDAHSSAEAKAKDKNRRGKNSELDKLESEARGLKTEAEKYEHISHEIHGNVTWIDLGHLGLELALVFCAVAVLTKQRAFWLTGIGFGIGGAVLAALGIWGWWTLDTAWAVAGHH